MCLAEGLGGRLAAEEVRGPAQSHSIAELFFWGVLDYKSVTDVGQTDRLIIVNNNRSTKFDVLVRVHSFVVLRENVQKNEKSVRM